MNAPVTELIKDDLQNGEETLHISLLEESLQCGDGISVFHLLATLREYHQMRDFSHQERFGRPDPHARRSLVELGEARRSLQALAQSLGKDGEDLHIEASLNVRMATR